MYKWLVKNLKKDNRGFTLIELALVIAILGILAGIAVPKYTSSKVSAAVAAHNANIKTLESAASMYLVDDGTDTTWTGAATGESWNNYLQEWPGIPKGLTKNDDFSMEVVSDNYSSNYDKSGEYQMRLKVVYDDGEFEFKTIGITVNEEEIQVNFLTKVWNEIKKISLYIWNIIKWPFEKLIELFA